MFIGRKNEIEEITKLINDKSTRLLNIWGSPGFGKTSTTVEVAHHLNESLRYRIYFFKLHCVKTEEKLLSKILRIFKSNAVDPTLTHLDKVVSIFEEISFPVILVFDNLDDVLSGESNPTDLRILLDELLDSNDNIKIVFTTRGLLHTTRGHVEGFRELRIRSLRLASSVKFVRQLLPSFSESVVRRVVEISFHVPLAMKILASSLAENTEDIVIEMLDEFNFSENILEQIDDHTFCEEKIKNIFESLFERLALDEKQALIALTLFTSVMIRKDSALEVISGKMGSRSKAVLSLNALVKKALIDKDVTNKCYSIHPLIFSFAFDTAKQGDFKAVLSSSRMCFCEYYLGLFERLNDDFLAGKSIDCPELEDTMQHLLISMLLGYQSSDMLSILSRILSKSEILFFLIKIPRVASHAVLNMYDLAIEKSKTLNDDNFVHLKLHVSKYFQNIAFSFFIKRVRAVDIPKSVRENISQLSDGTAAKLSCYEAIFDICNGYVIRGTVQIEKCLNGLHESPDHLLLKCMCLQILMVYYSSLKQAEKSREFGNMAFEVCSEIGNFNLFFTDDCDHKTDNVGESLVLFKYLFIKWSNKILQVGIKRYLFNSICKLQQQKEAKECCSPDYFNQIIVYGDYLVAWLSEKAGREVILNKKIECLNKSLISYQDFIDATGEAFLSISQQNAKMTSYMVKRLHFFHDLKIQFTDNKELFIEACRKALDSSLQHFGKQHEQTAECYYKIAVAEYNLENYDSSLSAFDQALQIMLNVSPVSDAYQFLSEIYREKGKVCVEVGKFEQAFSCYEKALNLQKTNSDDKENEEIAEILFLKGTLHYLCQDYAAALATNEHVLCIRANLFPEKRCSYKDLVYTYYAVGRLCDCLGNVSESKKCFESALEILKTSAVDGIYESEECIIEKIILCVELSIWKGDKNINTELMDRCLPLIKERGRWLLPLVYFAVAFNQLESEDIQAGLKFVQNALDFGLNVIQQAGHRHRIVIVKLYSSVVVALIKIGECKLAKKIVHTNLQIAETAPKAECPRMVLDCYSLRSCIYMIEQDYGSAIKPLQNALLYLSEAPSEMIGYLPEFSIRRNLAIANECHGSYKDALQEWYFIIKNCLVQESEDKAKAYFAIARISKKMNNDSLATRNLQLAYNAYFKVPGHPKIIPRRYDPDVTLYYTVEELCNQ